MLTMNILVVDDEVSICDIFSYYFEDFLGHCITKANNLEQLIDCLDKHTYDKIVLDIFLPNNILENIKKYNLTNVIYMTGHKGEFNVSPLIRKPFDLEQLESLLL